ncbi:MAG: NIPSNAP family protein [Candidatus Pedobacter colombiensis]|uniref:NIPSNAP family protein n=1 Tax=Candidatus Pedobacter colombiensis TaxID=3121371 RepID=A0AAJ5W998_9SPHI|nr:NIPSNAP family protein [Pedobacter sp.]WEK21113.1 MAG: NIPSNAP family protein [Pedobacter sp.]
MNKLSILFLSLLMMPIGYLYANNANRDFYQIKIYHLKNGEQEKTVDDFLKMAYLPALHRAGINNIGVFKPVQNTDTKGAENSEKLVYVFIPFTSYAHFTKIENTLEKDLKFQNDGKNYLNALHTDAPYERIESILLNAFEGNPKFSLPKLTAPKKDRVYELRSYEGPTEKRYKNKVEMFNKGGEIELFKRLGFNAVFYAEVISGSRMPNLMYLTTFENKADRDEHWKAFGKDEYWLKLKSMPEYQNNVSKNDTRFLTPTDYSDI